MRRSRHTPKGADPEAFGRRVARVAANLGTCGAAAALGVPRSLVYRMRKRFECAGGPVPHARRGDFKPKLTPAQRSAIRAAKGVECKAYLAHVHGVHPTTIQAIWNGRA